MDDIALVGAYPYILYILKIFNLKLYVLDMIFYLLIRPNYSKQLKNPNRIKSIHILMIMFDIVFYNIRLIMSKLFH